MPVPTFVDLDLSLLRVNQFEVFDRILKIADEVDDLRHVRVNIIALKHLFDNLDEAAVKQLFDNLDEAVEEEEVEEEEVEEED
ncbi:hypothetical protein G5I_07869 [Acromyrmex echinatior]|uniref:Uncharacterized protein n=1 Tax=Acromyrmex echinatior TaxID=103372 RepID=F4WPY9_ACREC|nr:hypothetical protein G5I_07869 [Acromyrmex echinatior]